MFFNQKPKRRRARSNAHRGGLLGWVRQAGLVGLLAVTGGSGGILHIPQLSTASAQQQPPMVQPPQVPQQQALFQQIPQQPPVQMPPNQQVLPQGQQQPPLQQNQMVLPAGSSGKGAPKDWPLDQALNLIRESQKSYGSVNSYQCTMISQERINGKLLPEAAMQLAFRKNPFSVYMKWVAPQKDVGQEVLFVYGNNQNRMQVLPAGFAKNFGWRPIEINDPLVMQHSRHKITETGIGNLIERCTKCWEAERLMGVTEVRMSDYEYNKRRCIRVETWHTQKHGSFYCWRNVIYFDSDTRLPIRMECYDWPRAGGPAEGELLECFSYIDINFNQVPDSVFATRK